MSALVETPFKLTSEEVLLSSASTLCLLQLEKLGIQGRTLNEVCSPPQYGFTASAQTENVGPRLVRITDIREGTINWNAVPFCDCSNPSTYELFSGDILVARSGSIGKSFMVTTIPEIAVFASYMIRLRAKREIIPAYLYWCLQSQHFWRQIMEAPRGSAMMNINGTMLASLRFPIPSRTIQESVTAFLEAFRERLHGGDTSLPELPPPLSEQQRIVARIENLSAKINEANVMRRKANRERQVVVKQAITKIDSDLRKTWPPTTLEQVSAQEKGSLRSGPFGSALLHSEFVPDGVPAIGIQDVQENNFVLTRRWNVTIEKAEELKRFKIRPKDVLVTVMGTLGRACVVPDNVPPMVSTKHIWSLTLNQFKVEPRWVSYWINYSGHVRKELLGKGTGTAIPGLNGTKIRALSLPSIPLSKQRQIVAYLDDLQVKIEALKKLQSETADELDQLLPSILDKAFKGEL